MIRGTAMMMFGLISSNACMMILGLGVLVRKCTCIPMLISKRNSNIIPYMWADGSIETTFDLSFSSGSTCFANWMFEQSAL